MPFYIIYIFIKETFILKYSYDVHIAHTLSRNLKVCLNLRTLRISLTKNLPMAQKKGGNGGEGKESYTMLGLKGLTELREA